MLTADQRAAGLRAVSRLTEGTGKSIKADPRAWVEAIGLAVLQATRTTEEALALEDLRLIGIAIMDKGVRVDPGTVQVRRLRRDPAPASANPADVPAWTCRTCGQANSSWCQECGRCSQARS